jgi:hypothetical protein
MALVAGEPSPRAAAIADKNFRADLFKPWDDQFVFSIVHSGYARMFGS